MQLVWRDAAGKLRGVTDPGDWATWLDSENRCC